MTVLVPGKQESIVLAEGCLLYRRVVPHLSHLLAIPNAPDTSGIVVTPGHEQAGVRAELCTDDVAASVRQDECSARHAPHVGRGAAPSHDGAIIWAEEAPLDRSIVEDGILRVGAAASKHPRPLRQRAPQSVRAGINAIGAPAAPAQHRASVVAEQHPSN